MPLSGNVRTLLRQISDELDDAASALKGNDLNAASESMTALAAMVQQLMEEVDRRGWGSD